MSPEWVAAIGTVVAAVATIGAAVAASLAVIATKKAPIDAAKIAASLQDASEKRRLKLLIFGTIMQYRHSIAEVDCVKVLNLIDTVFHDSQAVRDSWANLFAALNDKRNFPPTGPTPVIDEKKIALLAAMAQELGLSDNFRPDDFARVYFPNVILTEMQIRDLQRQAALNQLSGRTPPAANAPTPPVIFPPAPPKQ